MNKKKKQELQIIAIVPFCKKSVPNNTSSSLWKYNDTLTERSRASIPKREGKYSV